MMSLQPVRWAPGDDPPHISLGSVTCDASECRIELSGLHAVALVYFTAEGPLAHSKILFPTKITVPTHPRAYLQTHMALPASPVFRKVRFDGASLAFYTAPPVTVMRIFVSPTLPIVYVTITYPRASDIVRSEKGGTALLSEQTPYKLFRHHFWTNERTLVVAHTLDSTFQGPTSLPSPPTLPNSFRFTSPSSVLNLFSHFASIRSHNAIHEAPRLGLVHSPGGGMFYSGIWCNDQAEYAAPLLVQSCDPVVRKAAINSLHQLASWTTDSIPYSLEVDGHYQGRLDRGDAAMYAWGASLCVLSLGDADTTAQIFPHIRRACRILMQKIIDSPDGVVTSASDELEGRFPTSNANLSINCLAILAFQNAAEAAKLALQHSARDSDIDDLVQSYSETAVKLREAVQNYFQVSDSRKYQYYKKCPDARGWACLASLARLPDGDKALQFVLTSERMWCSRAPGVLVSDEHEDVWDRTTLYAIRAAFKAGMHELGLEKWVEFAHRRLTEFPSAPYAVENNSSHAQLSAESALCVRIITEGLLGMQVLSGRRIAIKPYCPGEWGGWSIGNVFVGGIALSFRVHKSKNDMALTASANGGECSTNLRFGEAVFLRVPEFVEEPRFGTITADWSLW